MNNKIAFDHWRKQMKCISRAFQVVGFAGLVLLFACPPYISSNRTLGQFRVLSTAELSATFGDNPTRQEPIEYDCTVGFKDGDTNCAFCESFSAPIPKRTVCCDCSGNPTEGKCEYTGSSACTGLWRKVGPINGSLGNCNTCTVSNPTKDGKCNAVVNGSGSACK